MTDEHAITMVLIGMDLGMLLVLIVMCIVWFKGK